MASTLAGQALVRRLLRRVAVVSTELTGINESNIYGQIGQRHDPAQITQMVGNINVTLDMLDQERQYASNVSHEVRSPLTGLRVELEEAQLHPELTDYPALIEHVLGCVDRMEAIATDLLLIARSHAAFAEREMIDLGELVCQEVLERTDPVPVEISCSPGVMVNAAPNQISEILINLLDNAQRYAARSVQVQVDRTGDTATLAVSDDGKGIAEHDRERIFDRLVRLKAAPSVAAAAPALVWPSPERSPKPTTDPSGPNRRPAAVPASSSNSRWPAEQRPGIGVGVLSQRDAPHCVAVESASSSVSSTGRRLCRPVI